MDEATSDAVRDTAQWVASCTTCQEGSGIIGCLQMSSEQRGICGPGTDAIRSYALAPKIDRYGLCQLNKSGLGGTIRNQALLCIKAANAPNRNNRSATGLDHNG